MTVTKPTGKLGDLLKIRSKEGYLLPQLQEVILSNAGDDPDRRQDVIHVSEMAKSDWCPRATYYRLAGWQIPDEKFNVVLENIFDEGNDIHVRWQKRMRQTGKLWGLWECSICHERKECTAAELDKRFDEDWGEEREDYCPVGNGEPLAHAWDYLEVHMSAEDSHLITAHADGAMDDFLVEIKSIGMGTLRIDAPKLLSRHYHKVEDTGKKVYDMDAIWKGLRAPLPSHVRQGMLYLWIAREMGLPYTRLVFLYEFKPNQQVKEFSVTLLDSIVDPLLYTAKSIKDALEDANAAPPDCPAGGCKYCEAIEEINGAHKGEGADPSHGSGVTEGSSDAGEPADTGGQLGDQARGRPPGRPKRRDGAGRQVADGTVPGAGSLGEVPDPAARIGTGRRVLRRSSTSST